MRCAAIRKAFLWAFLIGLTPAAASAADDKRYDLDCRGMERRVVDPYLVARASPWAPGKSPHLRTEHFTVDVGAGIWCEPAICVDHKPFKFDDVDPYSNRVYFRRQDGQHESVGLADNLFISVEEDLDGSVWLMRTKCKRLPFSGWRWHRTANGFAPG